jgi:hypothetical protein
MKSAEIECSIGTRFIMQFEGEECKEQRCLNFWNILHSLTYLKILGFLDLPTVNGILSAICDEFGRTA